MRNMLNVVALSALIIACVGGLFLVVVIAGQCADLQGAPQTGGVRISDLSDSLDMHSATISQQDSPEYMDWLSDYLGVTLIRIEPQSNYFVAMGVENGN